jgi:hypothetical protein
MVQPVIQMAAVDGGIGGLAAEQMNTEVSGPMAEGIMSTVAMEGGEEPPVNFNQGGDARRNTQDVKYYNYGGAVEYTGPRMPDRGYASNMMAQPIMDPRGPVGLGTGFSGGFGRKSKAQLSLEPFKEYLAEEVQNQAMQDVTSQVDPFIQDISAQASEKFGLNQGGQLLNGAIPAVNFPLMNGTGTQMPLPSLNAIPLAPSFSGQITGGQRDGFMPLAPAANFADGGPVQYFAPENENRVVTPTAVETEFQSLLPSYMAVAGSDPADYDKQRNLTQSQMLFDLAGAGLALAGGDGSKSFAQNLAEAAQNTQLFDKLSARTQSLSDFKTAQDKQDQALKLSVLQAAHGKVDAQEIAAAAAAAKPVDDNIFKLIEGDTFIYQGPLTQGALDEYKEEFPNLTVDRVYEDKSIGKNAQNLMYLGANGQQITIAAVPGSETYNNILAQGAVVMGNIGSDFVTKTKPVTFKMDVTVGNTTYKEGDFANLSQSILNRLDSSSWGDYVAPKFELKEFKDGDTTTLYQFDSTNPTSPIKIIEGTDPKNYVFQTIKDGNKTHLLRIDRDDSDDKGTIIQTGTDTDEYFFKEVKDGFTTKLMRFKKGDPDDTGTTVITATDAPVYRYETITDGGETKIMRFNNQKPDAAPIEVLTATDTSNPEYMRVTIRNSEGIMIPVTVDVTTEAGQKYLEKANKIVLDSKDPTAATVETIPTAKNNAKAYMLGNGDVFMSYDNGRTYLDANNQPQAFKPGDAFEIDNTKTYEIYKREQLNQQMRRELLQSDKQDSVKMTIPVYNDDGSPKLVDGKIVTRQMNASEVNDYLNTLEQVRLGTGTWSKIYAGLDNVLGGTLFPKSFNKMFGETQEARQFVRTIRIMGRSALASSPRFAIGDLKTTELLFPTEEQFFKNPESAVDQINLLAQYLQDEKTRLQEDIQIMSDKTLISQSLSKLNEIKKLQGIIGPIALLKNTQFDAELGGGSVNNRRTKQALKNIAKGENN